MAMAAEQVLADLGGVEELRVINKDTSAVVLAGRMPGSQQDAIIVLRRHPPPEGHVLALPDLPRRVAAALGQTKGAPPFWFASLSLPSLQPDALHVKVVAPASAAEMRAYAASSLVLVRETPALHRAVVLPWMQAAPAHRTDWIRAVLDNDAGSEQGRAALLRTSQAVLVPDVKWRDCSNTRALYCQALVRSSADPAGAVLLSLRQLRRHHVAVLRNIQRDCLAAIADTYGVPARCIRVFLHYLPSFFSLHIHFTHVDVPSVAMERAYLLDDVCANLELCDTYYADRTLTIQIPEDHPLYPQLTSSSE